MAAVCREASPRRPLSSSSGRTRGASWKKPGNSASRRSTRTSSSGESELAGDNERHDSESLMAQSIGLNENALVAITRDSLSALRAALFREVGPSAAALLQEAGFAGGPALYAAF